jgi:hypothetical protein
MATQDLTKQLFAGHPDHADRLRGAILALALTTFVVVVLVLAAVHGSPTGVTRYGR